jgi:hypothetical protein
MNSLAALALALLALGCGRVPLDLAATTGTAGASGGGGAAGSAGGRVPEQHRAASDCTPIDPSTSPLACRGPNPNPGLPDACGNDGECTAGRNGRCQAAPPSGVCRCIYDACVADSDCPVGQACACNPAFVGNACITSSCRVDGDCGAGKFCGPVIAPCGRAIVGYQCHSPQDRCLSDTDCPITDTCDAYAGEPWGCRIPVVCH